MTRHLSVTERIHLPVLTGTLRGRFRVVKASSGRPCPPGPRHFFAPHLSISIASHPQPREVVRGHDHETPVSFHVRRRRGACLPPHQDEPKQLPIIIFEPSGIQDEETAAAEHRRESRQRWRDAADHSRRHIQLRLRPSQPSTSNDAMSAERYSPYRRHVHWF